MRRKCIFFFKLVLVANIMVSEAQRISEEVTYEEDIAITAQEKRALDKFKTVVIPKIPRNSLIQNYVKDDLYFIKWLRAASFDVQNAENRLLEHLRWREAQKMDTVSDDDFPDFVRDFSVFLNITDKKHRPTAESWFSDWKLRDAALAGKGPEAAKWIITNFYERPQRQLFEARAKGVKVSQATIVADIAGFNLVQQACPICLPIIANMALAYVRHYPGLLESGIMINTPPTFDVVLRVIKPILGPQDGKLLKPFPGKHKWGPFLNGRYDRNQLSPRCGGTRNRDAERYR